MGLMFYIIIDTLKKEIYTGYHGNQLLALQHELPNSDSMIFMSHSFVST